MKPDLDIAEGAGHGRHFREQLVYERFCQPFDEVFGGAKVPRSLDEYQRGMKFRAPRL